MRWRFGRYKIDTTVQPFHSFYRYPKGLSIYKREDVICACVSGCIEQCNVIISISGICVLLLLAFLWFLLPTHFSNWPRLIYFPLRRYIIFQSFRTSQYKGSLDRFCLHLFGTCGCQSGSGASITEKVLGVFVAR